MVIPTVQVIYTLEIGGVEKLAVSLAAHQDRTAFRPSLCALDGGGPLAEELVRAGIPFHIMWRKGIEARVLWRLYRCFRQERARIVHTHQFAQLLFSLLPARMLGAKVVHTEHEFYLYRNDARARSLFRKLVRLCAALTVVGPEVARYYIEELGVDPQRVHVIPNGVDLECFDSAGRESRSGLALPEGAVVFGVVGRLEPEKDHGTLLHAFRDLVDRGRSVHLLLVGDGRLRGELELLARSLDLERSVTFLGTRSDIPELLRALDVFVLSSVHEGVPLSVVEAMAAGKPVIATDVGGLRLLVKPDDSGLLVSPGDRAALATAMSTLAANAELRARMGERGRQIARGSFGVSTMVDRYQDVYRSVIGERHVRN